MCHDFVILQCFAFKICTLTEYSPKKKNLTKLKVGVKVEVKLGVKATHKLLTSDL